MPSGPQQVVKVDINTPGNIPGFKGKRGPLRNQNITRAHLAQLRAAGIKVIVHEDAILDRGLLKTTSETTIPEAIPVAVEEAVSEPAPVVVPEPSTEAETLAKEPNEPAPVVIPEPSTEAETLAEEPNEETKSEVASDETDEEESTVENKGSFFAKKKKKNR